MGANLMAAENLTAETSGDKKGILLESGTNEFEIVEFSIGNVNYGINVAKVREVVTAQPVTSTGPSCRLRAWRIALRFL